MISTEVIKFVKKQKLGYVVTVKSGQYAELVASVDQVQEMRSPAYDRGATVEEIKEKYKTYYNQI